MCIRDRANFAELFPVPEPEVYADEPVEEAAPEPEPVAEEGGNV